MKSRHTLFTAAASVLLLFGTAGCEKAPEGVDLLTRDRDELSFDYSRSTATFTVRYRGAWSVTSEAGWLSFEPSEGIGDGISAQTVTVTAAHNTENSRSAIIRLLSVNGQAVEIAAEQGAGIFELGTPSIRGSIRVNSTSRATIDIPYSKAQGGERIRISTTLSGEAAAGLSIADAEQQIEKAGNGTISVPIRGTAVVMGEAVFTVSVARDGASPSKTELTTDIMDETTLMMMTASRFKWGGHYLEGEPGYKSIGENGNIYAADDDDPSRLTECAYGDAGTIDLFQSGAAYDQEALAAFRTARGIGGWTGYKVYEHPGYIKIGTGKNGGWIQTPALDAVEGTADITVEFEFFRWQGDDKQIDVIAVDGGEAIGGILPTEQKKWTKMSLRVKNATAKTKIKWSAAQDAAGYRFTLRNVFISQAKELKEPLMPPTDFRFVTTDATADCSWSSVLNASGYRVTLAEAAKPQFQLSAVVAETQHRFEGLEKDTEYLFTAQALYSENEAMNSPVSQPAALRTQQRIDPLSSPVVTAFRSERGLIVAEWTADAEKEASRSFDIELRDGTGNVLRSYGKVSYTPQYRFNRFTFGKLADAAPYIIAVRQLSSDIAAYKDSEWGTLALTSSATPDPTNVLFYEDFNDMWMGGDYANLSYAVRPETLASLKDYTAEADSFTAKYVIQNPASCLTDIGGPTTANRSYRDAYWRAWSEEWDALEVAGKALPYLTKIYPCAGCVKFGTGSANGVLSIPHMGALTSATDIVLTFDAWPYAIPNASNGSLEVSAAEGLQVTVYIESGAGTIDGAGSNGAIVLDNENPAANGSQAAGAFLATHHTVTIRGADATTRIAVASGDQPKYAGAKNRIWLDNLKVTKK